MSRTPTKDLDKIFVKESEVDNDPVEEELDQNADLAELLRITTSLLRRIKVLETELADVKKTKHMLTKQFDTLDAESKAMKKELDKGKSDKLDKPVAVQIFNKPSGLQAVDVNKLETNTVPTNNRTHVDKRNFGIKNIDQSDISDSDSLTNSDSETVGFQLPGRQRKQIRRQQRKERRAHREIASQDQLRAPNNSEFNKSSGSPINKKLYIGNVAPECTEKHIIQHLGQLHVNLKPNKIKKLSNESFCVRYG